MASAAPDLPRAAVRPTLQERLRPSLRRRLARSPLTYTLVLSTLFHLSMVTLFKVMIYFQQQEGQYYALQIIPETLPEPELEVAAVFPPPPSEGNLRLDGIDRALPGISLPTLEFAELERMREIYGGRVLEEQAQLSAGSLYERLYGGASQDSWAASVRGLHKLGESLTSLSWEQDALPKKAGAPEEPLPLSDNIEGIITWATKARGLLSTPDITALRTLDPLDLAHPVELLLHVDGQGKVTNIWTPETDPGEWLYDVRSTILRQYRFEPSASETDSVATLRIRVRQVP